VADSDLPNFKMVLRAEMADKISTFEYDDKTSRIFIGFDNGSIKVVECLPDSEMNYSLKEVRYKIVKK
jgi:hypothetical protein